VEDHRTVRIADLARRRPELDTFVRRLTFDGETTLDTHLAPGFSLGNLCLGGGGGRLLSRAAQASGRTFPLRRAALESNRQVVDFIRLSSPGRFSLSDVRLSLLPRPLREIKS